jgi:hypothetical protein
MKPLAVILFLFLFVGQSSCHIVKNGPYLTRNYVHVGHMMGHLQAPYVIDLTNGQKRLVFIGCDHDNDSTKREFVELGRYFTTLKPQIAFNEGGQVKPEKHYASRNEAIYSNAEIGYLKFLSDQAGINMMSGDLAENLEYSLMSQKYPKKELFLYYVMERLVIPYLQGAYGKKSFDELYSSDGIVKWFSEQGLPLTENGTKLTYFKQLYQSYMGHPFELSVNEDIEKFDYINGGDCRFCAVGRTSKMVRDSVLLSKIDHALDQYDRVIVTFGHGHALAVEPALKQIIRRKR